jgi:hypothetical protein
VPSVNSSVNAQGKFLAAPRLTKNLRSYGQPRATWRQYVTLVPDFGKHQGQTLLYDKRGDAGSEPTDGDIIGEGQLVPKVAPQFGQGTVTCRTSARAIDFTEDAETYSEFAIRPPIEASLADRAMKALNYRAELAFEDTNVMYIPTGTVDSPSPTWDVDGTVSTAATRDIQVYDLKNVVDGLMDGLYGSGNTSAPVEFWDGMNYMGGFSVKASRAIKDDPEWEKAQLYGDPQKLFNYEQGRIASVRCFVDNHILGALGTTSYNGECIIFGKDPVVECVALAEEVRVGIPANFGLDMAVAYVYMGGFAHVWQYGATFGDTTEADNRAVFITST